jgi:hypothetical protein
MEAPCPLCGKELPTKGALQMHMKKHAKENGQDFSLAGKGEEEGVGEVGCCCGGRGAVEGGCSRIVRVRLNQLIHQFPHQIHDLLFFLQIPHCKYHLFNVLFHS